MKKFLALSFSALLVACGGGGGGNSTVSASSQLIGTAATGAALANADVAIKNSTGTSPCDAVTITTDQLGRYVCKLKVGETAPFFIVVTDPTGGVAPLVSIATETPPAGATLTVNATPLTTAIIAQLNNGDALGLANGLQVNAGDLVKATTNILTQLRSVLDAIGLDATYNPFTTSITAATSESAGDTADWVLDIVKVTTTEAGTPAFSTVSDPTPVAMATATTLGNVVSKPSDEASELSKASQLFAKEISACFALPLLERVTFDTDNTIVDVSETCRSFVTRNNIPAGAHAFKNNGRPASWFFYDMLISDEMTGAKFSVPEIMLFQASTGDKRATTVINIRWIDNAGTPANIITEAQLFPQSSTADHPNDWWITGNQYAYDIDINMQVRREQDLSSDVSSSSGFRTGFFVRVNAITVATADKFGRSPAPGSETFDSVLVKGDGLPTAGLWYFRENNHALFTQAANRGAKPPTSFTPACSGCVSYWMTRSEGLTGTAATTYGSNSSSLNWSKVGDGSYIGSSGTRPTKGSKYSFDFYQSGVFVTTETRTLLTSLVNATQAIKLHWNQAGPNLLAALDPNNPLLNGPVSSLKIDWMQNASAEQIRNLWVSSADGGYDNRSPFKLGATSVIATPPLGTTFTDMTPEYSQEGPNVFSGYREVGMQYRMLDGSEKSAVYYYYKPWAP